MGLCGLGIYSASLGGPWRYLLCLVFSATGGIVPSSLVTGSQVHAPRPELVATTNGLIMQGGSLGSLTGPPALAAVVAAAGGLVRSALAAGLGGHGHGGHGPDPGPAGGLSREPGSARSRIM